LDNLDVITAESLLKVASRYQIEDVKRICEEVLADAIDSTNVVRHLLAAYLNKAIDLFESALDFVSENKDEIFNSPDMKHLMDEYPELFALIQREI
jgi:hypothetical protein